MEQQNYDKERKLEAGGKPVRECLLRKGARIRAYAQTDGQSENIMHSPHLLDVRRHKNYILLELLW